MNQFYVKKSILAVLVTGYVLNGYALETEHHSLSEVVVYADQNLALSSGQTISQQAIKTQPVANGNISDYLKNNPHIRLENSDSNTMQRGEIKPQAVSINGADISQTSYFVDNVNINNDLGFENGLVDGTMATMPFANHAQAYFFDASLLSSIKVYDSNVSASLGGFSGGAVVAKTKQYDGTDRIRLSYRTTHSAWAKFKVEEKDRINFENAVPNGLEAEYQPKYSKHFFNIMAEHGLTENLGMVVGFSRRDSHIQQTRLISPTGETDQRDHTRRSDNALLNLNWTPNNQHRLEWGLRYSNYREGKYYATNIDSDIKDYHNAFGSTLAWVNAFDSGILTTTLAYDEFQDKRKSNSTTMRTLFNADGDEYTTGGMGNSQLNQRNVHLSSEYALNAFDWGETHHSISVGGIYQFTQYHFNREQDAYAEIVTSLDFDDDGIIDYEEVVSNTAKKGRVNAKYQNLALYAEDLISWKDLEFRLGLRVERDDYLKNTNLAPRFVTRYQPFENSTFSLGLNRYYGRSFASMKLAEEIFKLDGHDSTRYQDITTFKTPYADELSLGFEQSLGNFAFNAKYILRNNKQRIVLHEGYDDNGDSVRYYRKGKDYQAHVYTFEVNQVEPWQLGISQWNTGFAFDWLDTKGIDYGRGYDDSSLLILDGKLMTYAEMRKKINNNLENWNIRFSLDMMIPQYHLTWSNNLQIKAPIKGIEELETASNPTAYRSYDYGTHTQWDMSLHWQPQIWQNHRPYLKVDLLNLLNKTRKSIGRYNDDLGIYSAGREYWLEVGYEF